MALRKGGGAVIALRTGVHTFDFETGEAVLVADPEAKDPATRFNDGKVGSPGPLPHRDHGDPDRSRGPRLDLPPRPRPSRCTA